MDELLNHKEAVWMNEGREYHLWYLGVITLKHNTLASIHGGASSKNGTKNESSCTIKSNVVHMEDCTVIFWLH